MPFNSNWQVIGGETPTAAKWSQLGENDDFLHNLILEAIKTIAPIGVIFDYWSNGGAISGHFKVCDGSVISDPDSPLNGLSTPDLRNRFKRGVANQNLRSNPVTGGEDSVTLTIAQMPQHRHSFSGTTSTNGNHQHKMYSNPSFTVAYTGSSSTRIFEAQPGYEQRSNSMTTAGNHNHTFSGNTSYQGSTQAHNNVPRYVGLVPIMRIK